MKSASANENGTAITSAMTAARTVPNSSLPTYDQKLLDDGAKIEASAVKPGRPLTKRKTKTAARVTRIVTPEARATPEKTRSPRPNLTPVYGPGMTGSVSSRSGGVVLTFLLYEPVGVQVSVCHSGGASVKRPR